MVPEEHIGNQSSLSSKQDKSTSNTQPRLVTADQQVDSDNSVLKFTQDIKHKLEKYRNILINSEKINQDQKDSNGNGPKSHYNKHKFQEDSN